MITYQEETLKQLRSKEWDDMLKLHAEELNKFSFPLNPDWDAYQNLDNAGILHIVTVRDGGILVGYYLSVIVSHPHYKDAIVAENDIHYISPDYRKGWFGYTFLKEVTRFLKDRGVDIIMHSMKADKAYLPVMERLGFKLIDYKLYMEV